MMTRKTKKKCTFVWYVLCAYVLFACMYPLYITVMRKRKLLVVRLTEKKVILFAYFSMYLVGLKYLYELYSSVLTKHLFVFDVTDAKSAHPYSAKAITEKKSDS
eukprot:GEMP01047500.1.p1 GENE.GEMP01047500.1~~GEMP01047500.1.p1  ORF type:complete len:104 (+),score=0.14 GEMP01047500.1:329-640(+)